MAGQIAAIIVAAGRGSRFSNGNDTPPKQYHLLSGRAVLSHTLDAFLRHPRVSTVLTVYAPEDQDLYLAATAEFANHDGAKLLKPVAGGSDRQASVLRGLEGVAAANPEFVLIHDAARPLVSPEIIDNVVAALANGAAAALAAVPVFDTLKRKAAASGPLETIDRSGLWAAQTPQGFRFAEILTAHRAARDRDLAPFTDDTSLAEWAGYAVDLAEGSSDNFKITNRADLLRAEKMLAMTQSPDFHSTSLAALGDIRIGTGYDVHAFEPGDGVILGGVTIPHDRGLKGHSDADVGLHAITDAILGAIADGDIGMHFPPSDPRWKGAASDQFLQEAVRRVIALGGQLAHIDVTFICETPKIGPHRDALRQAIATICALPLGRVSVKATTSEKLGFTGRKEGIAAIATATVRLPFTD